MTDITDEPVVRWMKEAGIADASHPVVEMIRKVAELARQDDAGYQRGLALAASICRHYAYGLHCPVSGSTPDAIDAVSTCAKLIDEQLDRARGSDK